MRLHSDSHTFRSIHEALERAKAGGHVAGHVFIDVCTGHVSRKKKAAHEIRLGTYTKVKGDKRGWTNTGNRGADSGDNGGGLYAATWDEWGWFIAELFDVDPDAVFGDYKTVHGFNAYTKNKFILGSQMSSEYPQAG